MFCLRPETDVEKMYYTFAILLGAFVHATIFGQVAYLVSTLSKGESEFNQHMNYMFDRMQYHNLPASLKERVATYFESLWERHRYCLTIIVVVKTC